MKKYGICWIVFMVAALCAMACGAKQAEGEKEGILVSEEDEAPEGNRTPESDSAVKREEAPEESGLQKRFRMENGERRAVKGILPEERAVHGNGFRQWEDGNRTDISEGNTASGEKAQGTDGGEAAKPAWSGDTVSGALSVQGTKLVDGSGNPVQLKGISTHGLAWYPAYVNKECIRQLKEEWGMNVFRLAMYTAEYGGYCSGGNKEDLKELVKAGVDYASEYGMYAIIDWHILSDANPNTYLEESKDFFREMSEEYADYSNVLYEICNEPNGGTSWSEVKSYAEQVIEVIRENDSDGVILVGTPNWCQYIEQAAADPIEGYDNIMYTLHFYAATHKEDLRNAMVRAIEAGLPVFVSEYGICDASGSGGIDEYQANQWVETMNAYQVSYVAWNLSNKGETSAVLKSSCSKVSGFAEEDLSDSGRWLYGMLKGAGVPPEMGNSDSESAKNGSEAEKGTEGAEQGNGSGQESEEPSAETGTESSGQGNAGTEWADGGLDVSLQVINSWGQGEESFYQYSLTLTNLTETDIGEWKVQIQFNGDIALNNGWNGNYRTEGSTLYITSMDYNGSVGRGGSADNIGFIVQGQEGLEIRSASGN